MWGELFQSGSIFEISQMLLFMAGIGFTLLTPFVWIFSKTVGLKEQPDRRALWTIAAAYAGASLIFIFGVGDFISPWFGPLVPLPGAIAIFLWLRNTYRRGWIDDDKVPDGAQLENSDWRIGIGVVVGAILAAVIKVIFLR